MTLTKSGSAKEFSACGEGPVMIVCLAVVDIMPDVMLCRTTGTSCLFGARLTIWQSSTWLSASAGRESCKQPRPPHHCNPAKSK